MNIIVRPSKEREVKDYVKKHPYDCLQPGDKGFDKVWGGKMRRDEEKMEKAKMKAEIEHQEIMERRNFRSNKTGGEWKRKIFV